eukprot:6193182-Pleurochrysis_carterae.AAC.2
MPSLSKFQVFARLGLPGWLEIQLARRCLCGKNQAPSAQCTRQRPVAARRLPSAVGGGAPPASGDAGDQGRFQRNGVRTNTCTAASALLRGPACRTAVEI